MMTRIRSLALIGTLTLFGATSAHADFVDYYTLDNWTFQTVGNGTVSPTTGDATTITLTSDSSEVGGFTDFFITIPADGIVSFEWVFTNDDLPAFEFAGYFVNGTRTDLTGGAGVSMSSLIAEMIAVTTGDTFGFYVESLDGIDVPGVFDVFSFSAPPAPAVVPLPAAGWLMLSALAGLGGLRRRRAPQ